MFLGKRYDEKVDIFSFGIVLCEVRAHGHPVGTCLTHRWLLSGVVTVVRVITNRPPSLFALADHRESLRRPRVPPQESELWAERGQVCGEVSAGRLSVTLLPAGGGLLRPLARQPVSKASPSLPPAAASGAAGSTYQHYDKGRNAHSSGRAGKC